MAKILMIDDDVMVLKLYSEILSKEGFEVLTSSEAKKGFDLAISQTPSLDYISKSAPKDKFVKQVKDILARKK